MRKLIGLLFVLTFCLSLTPAQQHNPAALDKWDVFAGYSLSRLYVVDEAPFPLNLSGGQVAGTYNYTKHLGATAEVAGYTKDASGVTFTTQGFLFGPTARFGLKYGKYPGVSFFAHQLFGLTRMTLTEDDGTACGAGTSPTCSSHPFTMASGGGVDVKLNKRFSVRPLQVEYFSEQVSLDSIGFLAVPVGPSPRSAAHPDNTGGSGIRITAQGFRYSGGVVARF
jgi:hypothetical protein